MKQINWGVIGTAGIAKGQTIPGMAEAENCRLYAIAGRSMEKALAYQKEFGFAKAYGDYEELLNDPEVEAVYIPLPNTLHHEWVVKAANAGKHILCEKPLAPSAREAEEMQAAAQQNGVMLMEAFAYLHTPLIAAIKAALADRPYSPPPFSRVVDIALRQAREMAEWKGERSALLEMRKHFAWYTAGRRNSAQVRTKVNLAQSFDEVEALLRTLE